MTIPVSASTRRNSAGGQEDVHAGDGLQLVEGAAGVAQAAAGQHRHLDPAGGDQRGDDEADLVADAAGAVLVDLRAGHRRPGECGRRKRASARSGRPSPARSGRGGRRP